MWLGDGHAPPKLRPPDSSRQSRINEHGGEPIHMARKRGGPTTVTGIDRSPPPCDAIAQVVEISTLKTSACYRTVRIQTSTSGQTSPC